jgi:hypothetical protein
MTLHSRRQRYALGGYFALNGLGLASWVPRIPEIRNELGLGAGELGAVLPAFGRTPTTVWMIRSKFGGYVRCKTETAMKNAVYWKVLCHNICYLIQPVYELGIEPAFILGRQSRTASFA